MASRRLEQKIANDLEDAGFAVERQPAVSGLRPDLLVTTPDERRFIVEVKEWSARPGFAARAGTTTAYPWGDEPGSNKANFRTSGSEWGGAQSAPVGSFDANPWGLHDMNGNVSEWTCSEWHPGLIGQEQQCVAEYSGREGRRVRRGGSWSHDAGRARSADRDLSFSPYVSDFYTGFRVLCSSPIE